MIQEFVLRFDANRERLRASFASKHPDDYKDIVRRVVEILHDEDRYGESPDPERIHQIDDGHYQGTLFFAIGATGYQPSTYYCVLVRYGSCSGCDTLQRLRGYTEEPPTEEQVAGYMQLALGIVQRMKRLGAWGDSD